MVDDEKLKELYASREPYGEWIDRNLVQLSGLKIPNVKVEGYTGEQLTRLQKVFGYKYEDVNTILCFAANWQNYEILLILNHLQFISLYPRRTRHRQGAD